jgi:hypothetical protein
VIEGETLGFDTHTLGSVPLRRRQSAKGHSPVRPRERSSASRSAGAWATCWSRTSTSRRADHDAIEHQAARRKRKLGDYLTRGQIISRSDLAAAIERQRQMPVMRLGRSARGDEPDQR